MELRHVRRIAFEKGMGKNYVCKEQRITEALTKIYIIFKNEVVLKGGTAMNRAYIKENGRFSEDIDLDFINNDIEAAKRHICEMMKNLQGFIVEKPRLMKKTFRFDCYYKNELNHKDKIKIEFYLGHDSLIGKAEDIAIESPILEGQTNIMMTYSLESLIARKIVALLRREEGKDLYDLFFALKKSYNKKEMNKVLEGMCVFYAIDHGSIHKMLDEKFEKITANIKYIGNSTNHYLSNENNIAWPIIAQETERMLKDAVR